MTNVHGPTQRKIVIEDTGYSYTVAYVRKQPALFLEALDNYTQTTNCETYGHLCDAIEYAELLTSVFNLSLSQIKIPRPTRDVAQANLRAHEDYRALQSEVKRLLNRGATNSAIETWLLWTVDNCRLTLSEYLGVRYLDDSEGCTYTACVREYCEQLRVLYRDELAGQEEISLW